MRTIKSLQLQAYEHIKNKILSGEMAYDEIYSETKIAKELGISRTPMRDAIQYLSQEKYIDIIPNKGFCLHKMGMQDFMETYQIRSAVEGYCARQIAQDAQTARGLSTIAVLQSCMDRQQQALGDQYDAFFEADTLFHETLIAYVENSQLEELFGNYMYRMRNFAMNSLHHPGRMEQAYQEHLDILQTIQRGDAIGTYERVLFHMESPKYICMDGV